MAEQTQKEQADATDQLQQLMMHDTRLAELIQA